jgi:hypothetical protein
MRQSRGRPDPPGRVLRAPRAAHLIRRGCRAPIDMADHEECLGNGDGYYLQMAYNFAKRLKSLKGLTPYTVYLQMLAKRARTLYHASILSHPGTKHLGETWS